MRRLFRWLLRIAVTLGVLLIVALLAKDALLKEYFQWRIRRETGFDASIGRFEMSVLKPTVLIGDLRLYNPPEFGGSTFLHVPELRFEYDLAAASRRELHLRSLELTLAELNLVKDPSGRWNLHVFEGSDPDPSGGTNAVPLVKLPVNFTGIDTLTLTLGTVRQSFMNQPDKTEVLNVGITNRVLHNVTSASDLLPLVLGQAIEGMRPDKRLKKLKVRPQ